MRERGDITYLKQMDGNYNIINVIKQYRSRWKENKEYNFC